MSNNTLKVECRPYTIYGNQDTIALTTSVSEFDDHMLHMVPSGWSAESIYKEARKYDNGFYNSLSPAVSAHYIRYTNRDDRLIGEFSNLSTIEISAKTSAWIHVYGSHQTTIFTDGTTVPILMHDPRFVLFHCSGIYWLIFSPGIVKNKTPMSVYRNNVMTKMYGVEFSGSAFIMAVGASISCSRPYMNAMAARNINTVRKLPRESKLTIDSLVEIKARIEHMMRTSPSDPTKAVTGMTTTYTFARGSTIGQAWLAPDEYIGQVIPGVIIMGLRTDIGLLRLYEFDLNEESSVSLVWNPGFLESEIPSIGYFKSGFVSLGPDILQNIVHDSYQDIFHTACRIMLVTRPETHENEAALWAATHILHKHKCPLPGGPDSYLPSNRVRDLYSEFIETLTKREFRDIHHKMTQNFKWMDGLKILLHLNPTTSGVGFSTILRDVIVDLDTYESRTRPDPETEYACYMVNKILDADPVDEWTETLSDFPRLAREIIHSKLFNYQISTKCKDRMSQTDILRFYETDENGRLVMKEDKVSLEYACMTRPEAAVNPQSADYNSCTSLRGSLFTRPIDFGLVNVRDSQYEHTLNFNEISVMVILPVNTRFHMALDIPAHNNAVYDRLLSVPLDTGFRMVVAKGDSVSYHDEFDRYTQGDTISNVFISGILKFHIMEEVREDEDDSRLKHTELELLPVQPQSTLSTLGSKSETYTMAVVGNRQDIISNILTGTTMPARFTTQNCILTKIQTMEDILGASPEDRDRTIISMLQDIHSRLVDTDTLVKMQASVERMEEKIGSLSNQDLEDVHSKHKVNTIMGVLSNMQNQLDMNGEGIDSTYDIMSIAIPSIETKVTDTFTPDVKRALEDLPGTVHAAIAGYSDEVVANVKDVTQIIQDMKRSRGMDASDKAIKDRSVQNPSAYMTDQEAIKDMLEELSLRSIRQDAQLEDLAKTNKFLVENIGELAIAMRNML